MGQNISALSVRRRINEASRELGVVYTRLGSGQRINSAADDAASLATAAELEVSRRVYTRSIQNINDGIGAVSIVESSLTQLSNIMIRQRELAEQAANGAYSRTQRSALDTEASALTDEYNRIIATTKFNGNAILSSSATEIQLQAGFGTTDVLTGQIGTQLGRTVGTGTFSSYSSFAAGSSPAFVSISDMNGDQLNDIVAFDNSNSGISILIGNGNGTFKAQISTPIIGGSWEGIVRDFNNDGASDVIANQGSDLYVYLGNGNGTLRSRFQVASGTTATGGMSVGDFNGDGSLDIGVGDIGSIVLGNGNGSFRAPITLTGATGTDTTSIIAADFNGDGKDEMALVEGPNNRITIAALNDSGSLTTISSADISDPQWGSSGDINHDGLMDIVVGSQDVSGIFTLLGNGDGTFKAAVSFSTFPSSTFGKTVDLNGDGLLDLVSSAYGGSSFSIAIGNGNGTFQAATSTLSGAHSWGLALGDLNNDGVTDVTVGSYNAGATSISVSLQGSNYSNNAERLDLMTQSGARQALTTTSAYLERISSEKGRTGAFRSRLESGLRSLESLRVNYAAAESRIRDSDTAADVARSIALTTRLSLASEVLKQTKLFDQIVLQLITDR